MKSNFRPSEVQLDYLNQDMLPYLKELGMDVEKYEWNIGSINWYNWDNKPRWFVLIKKYEVIGQFKYVGYIEVDIDCTDWNGSDNPLGIESIEYAGHGYPCSAIEVAKEVDGDYVICE